MIEPPVLCFFAHPDDETLAAGGTIARFAPDVEFAFAVPATGIAARVPICSAPTLKTASETQRQINMLKQNCERAISILGVAESALLRFGKFPDNQLDDIPLLDLIHWLERIVVRLHPRTILTHAPQCLNVDHRYCYEAVMVATRQSNIAVLCGEVPGSTGVLAAWRPNLYVKLAQEHINRKIAAMESYESERRESPHPRSPGMLEALARVRGSECGAEFAEAFVVQRWVM